VLFIIDVWLWLGLGFATWFSLRRGKRGGDWHRPARIALAGALAYVGMNSAITWLDETITGTSGETVIASPVPLAFWQRDTIVGEPNDWSVRDPDGEFPQFRAISSYRCAWPDVEAIRQTNADLNAFLFWSRAPFAERAPDGSVLIRDARFYDPRAADRFTVALPEVRCESLPRPS
jgi:inner membrane protein